MHQLLTRWHKVAGIVLLTYAVIWGGLYIGLGWLKLGTAVAMVDGAVVYLFGKSWPALSAVVRFCPCLTKILPGWAQFDLRGEWTGTLLSEWKDENGNGVSPKVVNLTFTQAWTKIVITARTDEMTGVSTHAIPSYDADTDEFRIGYFFATRPRAAVSQKNPPQQYGCAIATIRLSNPKKMIIRYTNERSPGGEIHVDKVS